MVTHSIKAAASASQVLFIRDGEVYLQLYRMNSSLEDFYEKISSALTVMIKENKYE